MLLGLLHSAHTSVRTKRSKSSFSPSKRYGCSLGTCIVHDLPDRLVQINNRLKTGSAPMDKISPQGYGRRRRSLPDRRVSLRLDKGKIMPVWSQTNSQVHKLEALLRRTWAGLWKRSLEQRSGSSWDLVLICSTQRFFFRCLRLLPGILQHIVLSKRMEDWVRARLAAAQKCWTCTELQLAQRHWIAQWRTN